MNTDVKDLVIIGAGPAGLSASLYASQALLDVLTIEGEAIGGQALLTSEIDNYPGVAATDGASLIDSMRTQAESLGASFVEASAQTIVRDDATGSFLITTTTGSCFNTRSIILAGGATTRHAGFEGELKFTGHGVSYCATCDAFFYRGKQVYVVGGGNSAAEETLFLTKFASKVTMLVRKDHLRAQPMIQRQLEKNDKVELLYSTSIERLAGDSLQPDTLILKNGSTGERKVISAEAGSFGVFVFVGHTPASSLVRKLVDVDESGAIITGERMETKTPGLFAAGDIRHKPLRQIVTAVSDGAIAATSASQYLGKQVEA